MPMFIYACETCKRSKQHFFSTVSQRVVSCVCGETEKYKKQMGKTHMLVRHSNMADKMEADIDPWVAETYKKIGTEMISGDVKTLQNVFGEDKVSSTFYEDEVWIDETDYEK